MRTVGHVVWDSGRIARPSPITAALTANRKMLWTGASTRYSTLFARGASALRVLAPLSPLY